MTKRTASRFAAGGGKNVVKSDTVDFPGGSDGKESSCNAEDPGSSSGSGRSLGEENGNSLSMLAWRIPWTEESGRLQSMGSQRVGHN